MLDFRGSGTIFVDMFMLFGVASSGYSLRWRHAVSATNAEDAKNAQIPNSVPGGPGSQRWGGGGAPPRGVSIRRPTFGGAKRARYRGAVSAKYASSSSCQKLLLDILAQDASEPLSFSLPGSMGTTGIQRQNLATSVKFDIFFDFFGF